jgi:O-antigen/teichoic acid export membrane protein
MSLRRSLWITFAFSNASTIALFLVSLVVARILTPEEIGIFSLSVVVINIASIFRDLGCNPYMVRKAELSNDDIASVFGITLTTSVVLAATIWLLRVPISAYFGEARIAGVLQILAFNFLLVPPSAVMSAVLVRNLSAGRSALVSASATVAYGCTILTLALLGFGEKAQAWANTALLLTNLVAYRLAMPAGFRLRPRWKGWGEPLRFSGGVLSANIVGMANMALPEALIGRQLGAHDVGIYSRSNGLAGLFNQAVGPTLGFNVLPVLARAFHEGAEAFATTLRRSAEMLTGLAWPVYIWLASFPDEIIRVLYGPNWGAAAELVPMLCITAMARTPFSIIPPALQAADRTMSGAFAALPTLLLRLALVALVPEGGLYRFVLLLCMADVLALSAWAWVVRRHLGLGFWPFLRSQARSVGVGLACLLACLLVKGLSYIAGMPALPTVLLSALAVAAVWPVFILWLDHPLGDELRKVMIKIRLG